MVVPSGCNSVKVTWSELAHNIPFTVVAYNILYRVTEAINDPFTERVARAGKTSEELNGLLPDTNYTIHMITYTAGRESKRSPGVTVVTACATSVVTGQPSDG